jgi:hypothetical protein
VRVTVATADGAPYLALDDGGVATYASGSGTNALAFTYRVTAGQSTSDLAVTGLVTNGGAIVDGAGNAAVFPTSAGALGGDIEIDTTTPQVVSVTPSGPGIVNGVGDLDAGKVVTLTVGFSEDVTVNTTNGAPYLKLNDGGTATYAGGSGGNALTFNYTVAAGQNTSALTATALKLNGGTIDDQAGNAANLSLSGIAQAGPEIETTPPKITAIAAASPGVDLTTGQTEAITLTTSEPVDVSGKPALTLNNGGQAIYVSGSGTDKLVFDYTAAAGQKTPDLTVTGIQTPSSASITDAAGNALSVTGAKFGLNIAVNDAIIISGTQTAKISGASAQAITFATGATGTLALADSQKFFGRISGFAPGDALDLEDIAFGPNTTVGYSGGSSQGVLTVSEGAYVAKLALLGNYMASTFVESSDGHGGTLISDPIATAHQASLSNPHHA